MTAPRIFISYSREDKAIAEYIHSELKKLSVDAFIDYRGLDEGDDFHERLAGEIKSCDIVLYLVSEHSVISSWVRVELKFAFKHHKKIVPIALDELEIPDALFFVDLIHRRPFEANEESIARLFKALGIDVGAHRNATIPTQPTSLELMLQPFDWCEIPAGKVTLEPGGYLKERTTFDVPSFWMAKYPVTNAQYAQFIEAGGYTNKAWWMDKGWQTREQENWTQPQYWTDTKWNGADYPVVGVSWYESVAFCLWLSETTGEKIILPTEQQWQRAAQGNDGRAYPWGKTFDETNCNTIESDIRHITPVTQYPQGASPFGVIDLAGNVREWCVTGFYYGEDMNPRDHLRVVRSGSWIDDRDGIHAAYRNNWIREIVIMGRGFVSLALNPAFRLSIPVF